MADDVCRGLLEQVANGLESDDKKEVPSKVRYHKETYRINKKSPLQVATRFGAITLRSFYYLPETAGEAGLHPLRVRLGIGAGAATPALMERVARMQGKRTTNYRGASSRLEKQARGEPCEGGGDTLPEAGWVQQGSRNAPFDVCDGTGTRAFFIR